MNPININRHIFSIAILLIAFSSCNTKKAAIPFPLQETEFTAPVTIPLKFSKPKKINWVTTVPDTVKPPEIKTIDFNKMPSRPFYPDGFRPLNKPVEEGKFDMSSLPDTSFAIDKIPARHLQLRTSLIAPPVIIKAGLPKLRKNAATGIFEFNEDQGLPGYFVTAMLQDSHGMMWIATDKALCRFDGEHLEMYSFIDVTFIGSMAGVTKIIEDKQGRIWIKTDFAGIYILDIKAGTVIHFNLPPDAIQGNNDYEMIADSRGSIWIGSIRTGMFIIDPTMQTLRNLPDLHAADQGNAKQILEDNNGNIWVGSLHGLSIINSKTGIIHFMGRDNLLLSDTITGLRMDGENNIWMGTAAGIYIINPNQGSIKHIGKEQGILNPINHFAEDNSGKQWMASDSGVYIFDKASQKLKYLDAARGLTDNKIKTILKDKQEQMWIATYSGLNLVEAKGFMPDYITEKDGISGTDVWTFAEDGQKRIWIGSRQGIDIYNPKNQTIQSVEKDLLIKTGRTPQFEFINGKIVMASQLNGINLIDPLTGRVTCFGKEQGAKNVLLSSYLVDNTGSIWTGSFQQQGIEIIDPEKKSFTRIKNSDGLLGRIVWSLFQDNNGEVWAATDSGINVINLQEKTIRYLIPGGKVSDDNGGTILSDDQGRVWIGTRNQIYIADLKKKLLTSIAPANGLAAPDTYTLFQHKDHIYAGTGNGLTVFTKRSNQPAGEKNQPEWDISSYGMAQGFLYNNYNANAVLAVNNKLWWGIEDKALVITNEATDDTTITATYISGITISDQRSSFTDNKWVQQHLPGTDTVWSAKKDTFYLTDKLPADSGWLQKNNIVWDSLSGNFNLPVNLVIPHNQNYLSFQFTGAQLANRDKVLYRYLLEGFDNNWSAITGNTFSENYRDIPAGEYTFKVCSRNAGGSWSQPAEFSFTILRPWWNTWWAWLLYAVSFFGIVWLIVQYRSRLLKKENRILEEKVSHRTEQLRKSLEDLKSTQSQLIQSEKMASLGELTAGIAHEIQNPLNFVNNFSEVNKELIDELRVERKKEYRDLQSEEDILRDLENNLEKIAHHGKRADAIVKGMLQHSRNNNGQKESTNINALADEYLRLAYHGLRAKDKSFNATLKTDFDETIGNINIVSQDIGRVLLNLINNAFYVVAEKKKQMGNGYEPTVSVSTKKVSDKVFISVQDNGNGIPQKVLDKIFQPFFTTKPTGQGTGLGLSLSYDIVKAHGGEIKVETKEEDGSKFIIQLPVIS